MWLDKYAPVLAVADTTRPILLIVFIVGLFGLAGLGVVLGRKRMSAQNARALSEDAGLAKGSTKGGDGTFSAEWAAEVRDEVDDVPRQSWSDVLTMQGIAPTTDSGASPFATDEQPVYEQPATATYEQPVYDEPAAVYAEPAAAAYEQPVYEQPVAPTYEQPAYEQTAYEQPAYEQPAYEQTAYEQTAYEQPAYEEPAYEEPVHEPAPPAPLASTTQASLPGGQYAAYFGAAPPPPPPPSEPLNIWDADTDQH